jgi:hypothetical protein
VQGCVGCHESRTEDAPPAAAQKLIATQRPPDVMTGWRGKTEPFDYMKTIQPIWDKHCVKCHDFGENKPAGQKLLLAGDRTHSFNASYIDLWSRNYLSCPGGGPAAHYEAKAWGSHPSKLVKVLEGGLPKTSPGHAKHKKVKLSKDELQAIYTWIDLNAVYYPTYECAYPNNPNGRSPLTGAQYSQLQKLTGVHFIRNNATNVRTRLSFERPEKSPCLKKLDKNSKEYAQALAIIQAGQEQLRKRPRADMPGFVPCERDLEHNKKYAARQAIEARNRKALAEGRKEYD